MRIGGVYTGDVVSYSDYYPYGALLPNRHGSSNEGYRYGFQGQEIDSEIKGEGNNVNYKYRMHDPRIGRFFAVDPLANKYAWYTPYSFSGNKVIGWIELEGLEEYKVAISWDKESRKDGTRVVYFAKIQVEITYIQEQNRLPSSPTANDKNRKADYFINGKYINVKEGFGTGTYEKMLSDLEFKEELLIGSDGKSLPDPGSYRGYTLAEATIKNGDKYVTSTITNELWSTLNKKNIELKVLEMNSEVNSGDAKVMADNLLKMPYLELQIKSQSGNGRSPQDALQESQNVKNRIISNLPSDCTKQQIQSISDRIKVTEGSSTPSSTPQTITIYSVPE